MSDPTPDPRMSQLRDLAVQQVDLEMRKEQLEETLKQINSDLDFVRKVKIPQLMADLQLRSATFENLAGMAKARVQLAEDIYASTREGQKDAAMTWLRDLGYEDMITETYNASSIKALFRRMLKEGKPIDEAIFSVTPFTRASVVKA